MYDVTIIGAGVIGTFIARELSKYNLKILLIDKENDVSNGTTKANTALVHAGFDAPTNSNMSYFNVQGNAMFDKICEELDVPFERTGALVLAFDHKDLKIIEKLYNRGLKSKVPDIKILRQKEVKAMEPNVSDEVQGALYAKTAGIIGPWELAIALAENAVENGVELKLNTEVMNISNYKDIYTIYTNNGDFKTKVLVNAAGVYGDKINNMISNDKINIVPKKGQYYLLDKTAGNLVNTTIFQCPTSKGKGVVVSPTIHGNLIVGPDSEIVDEKSDTSTTKNNLEYILKTAQKSIPNIPFKEVITTFSGVRAETKSGDFIIEEVDGIKGFINVIGIKSPGLSAAPAIATHVEKLIIKHFLNLKYKSDYNPIRRKMVHFNELSDEEKSRLIKKNPMYGNVICRCETITEAEIVDAIHRKAGATTVDGIKRRVRPGSGRCQGGFCMPRVMEILARELNTSIDSIVKDGLDSNILIGKTK